MVHLLSHLHAVAVALRATRAFRTAKRLQGLIQIRGEDRNRTYLATCVATTVLKTARATRHPSLSGLRKTPNAQRPTSNAEFLARETRFEVRRLDAAFEGLNAEPRITETDASGWLFCLLDRLNDLVEIRPLAGLEFGMEQFAIGANFEGAAARGNQRKRLDALAEFENFGRQTDGLRRVVSNDAVFD